MKPYTVREAISIPYFDHDDKSLSRTIKNSSSRRGISPFRFIIRKIKNIFYTRWAYNCPLNSIRVKLNRKRGVTIGENVYIGQWSILDNAYPEYIYIEDNVSLAGGNVLIAHSNPYPHFKNIVESGVSPIVIKEGAWIGSGATILRGVTIGKNSIVCAGTVVDKDVPEYSMVRGNPMKVVAEYKVLM